MANIKFSATMDNVSVNKNGLLKARFKAPTLELPETIKLLTTLEHVLMIAVINEGRKKVVKEVLVDRIAFDKEGESTITFYGQAEANDDALPFLTQCNQKPIMLTIKSTGRKAEEEDDE